MIIYEINFTAYDIWKRIIVANYYLNVIFFKKKTG